MLEEAKADLATPSDIPGPYFEVTVLDLTVNWTRDRESKERVFLTITKAFDVTMSPTMEVQWVSASGETHSAILKFFDRSYGIPECLNGPRIQKTVSASRHVGRETFSPAKHPISLII